MSTEFPTNLDELEELAESIKNSIPFEDAKWLLFALGMLPNQGKSTTISVGLEDIIVDASISSIRIELNALGFETLACCSGLASEHIDSVVNTPAGGYVAVRPQNGLHELLRLRLSENCFSVESSLCYFQEAVVIHIHAASDADMLANWELLMKAFRDIYENGSF